MGRRVIGVLAVLLAAGAAGAAVFGGGGNGAAAVVDVLSDLVGKNVVANSYTATNTTGPGFQSTGDRVDAVRLGTNPRATIGTCQSGGVCIGPDDLGYATRLFVWGTIGTQAMQIRDNLDVLGNAAILNNNGPVRVRDTDGFSVNDGTPLKGEYALKNNVIDFPEVSNGSCNSLDYPLSDAKVGDLVGVQAEFDYGDDAPDVTVRGGRVPVDGTVRIRFCNSSPMTQEDPPSGPYTIFLRRY